MTEHTLPCFKMKKISRDSMPREAAIELLIAGVSGAARNSAKRALETVYVSTTKSKSQSEKISNRFRNASATQLARWLRRFNQRRVKLQGPYQQLLEAIQRAPAGDDKQRSLLERAKTALDLAAAQLDLKRDLTEDELTKRGSLHAR